MPAKGTGGKHLEPKEKKDWKEKKQWVKKSGTRTGPGTVKTAQKKAEKAVVAKAKSNRDATQKMYAAESMFKSEKLEIRLKLLQEKLDLSKMHSMLLLKKVNLDLWLEESLT